MPNWDKQAEGQWRADTGEASPQRQVERNSHCFYTCGHGVHEADLVSLWLPTLTGDIVQAHYFVARVQEPVYIQKSHINMVRTSEKGEMSQGLLLQPGAPTLPAIQEHQQAS